ncbi:MAG: helix-turn-helix domain-containing protein [Parvibaculum sp.]|uniref:helix-turn-helix domain-containing protein n=1 Tax=Parvibaculum sp. TaxID=2024848 RepID=UPI0025E380C6|nr:helix-turn-helix domain-containing protein [Parvibaculum sp.]MCE9650421.1 helix-turn-helix domain-containing protein [Parvibaculum sp.]
MLFVPTYSSFARGDIIVTAPQNELLTLRMIAGVENLRDLIQGIDFVATQLAPGPCQGDLMHADLAGLRFSAGTFDAHVRLQGVVPRDRVMICAMLKYEGAHGHWNGELAEGDVCVCPAGQSQKGHFKGSTSYVAVSLPLPEIREVARALDGLDWSRSGLYRPPAQARADLRRKLATCISMLQSFGSDLSGRARAFLRDEILDSYLDALADAVLAGSSPMPIAPGEEIVKLVEDYLAERHPARVRVNDLCVALKISRRTLYRAFHETLGVGPKAYLRLTALSMARCVLVEASPGETSVTEVALNHGFPELGRFSVLYRQMFGESPSDTLRRQA